MTDPTCIFCKIIAGQIPAFNVYEDEHTFAFLDIAPFEKGHVLVVPKHHAAYLTDLGPEVLFPFIAAVQTTEAGHPLFACLTKREFTKEAIAQWAKKSRCASAQVVSDGLWCFQAVTASGAAHERTVTGGGPASVKLATFRAVNTLLGNLKTACSGTYHAFDFAKYAHRYLAEVQYRFNRRFDLSVILARLLHASAVTSPHPERIIRAAEQCG